MKTAFRKAVKISPPSLNDSNISSCIHKSQNHSSANNNRKEEQKPSPKKIANQKNIFF